MIEIITSYNRLKKNLPFLLDMSGYRLDYIAESLGFNKSYFYNKKSKNKFSNEEFEKIINFIWRDDLEDKFLIEVMKQSEQSDRLGEEQTKKMIDEMLNL
jgi:hypothetical protein